MKLKFCLFSEFTYKSNYSVRWDGRVEKKPHTTNKHKRAADNHLVTVNFNFVTLTEQLTPFTDVVFKDVVLILSI